jgi:hypothetical protein
LPTPRSERSFYRSRPLNVRVGLYATGDICSRQTKPSPVMRGPDGTESELLKPGKDYFIPDC